MKKTLALLPGMMSDARLWAPQIEALRGDVDLKICFFPHLDSLEEMAQEVLSSITGSFAVIGTSMGGYLAQEVAEMSQGRVSHLGIFNSNPFADSQQKIVQRKEEIAKGLAEFNSVRASGEYFKAFLAEKSKENQEIINLLKAQSLDLGYKTFINHQTACITRKPKINFLRTLRIPITVLGGIEDSITPIDGQIEIVRNVHNCRFVMLNDCGHIASLEQPEETTFEIKKLLSRG